MKKLWLLLIVGIFQMGTVFAQNAVLDGKIFNAVQYLSKHLPNSKTVLVLHLKADSKTVQDNVIEKLINGLSSAYSGRVQRIGNTSSAIKAYDLAFSDEIDSETALSIGKELNVDVVIYGAIISQGSNYNISVQAVSVERGKTYFSNSYTAK
ncbi:hypothetical protein ACYULU_12365 [Breznakiellaceae bacterium SP9]